MTRRSWGVGGWLVAACAVCVGAGCYVGLLVWQPAAAGLLTTHLGFALVVSSVRNRNLIAELEAARARKDTAIEAGMGVAFQVQELERRISGEHEPIEVESFMADSQRCPRCKGLGEVCDVHQLGGCRDCDLGDRSLSGCPDCAPSNADRATGRVSDGPFGRTYSLDEVMAEHGVTQADLDAIPDDVEPSRPMTEAETERLMASLQALPGTDDMGQACGYGVRSDEDCGDPAEGWVMVGGAPWFLCARHYSEVIERGETDIDVSDGPRSLPGRWF